jgi:integrase
MKSARADRSANSFEVVAQEWFAKYSATWAANHGNRIIWRFERDIFPWIGGRPIAEVTAPELLALVRRIENRGAQETAHRALGRGVPLCSGDRAVQTFNRIRGVDHF